MLMSKWPVSECVLRNASQCLQKKLPRRLHSRTQLSQMTVLVLPSKTKTTFRYQKKREKKSYICSYIMLFVSFILFFTYVIFSVLQSIIKRKLFVITRQTYGKEFLCWFTPLLVVQHREFSFIFSPHKYDDRCK